MIYDRERFGKEQVKHRREVRSVYKEGYGQTELFNILHDAGCFRVISEDELDARNRAILKAEELGILDENIVRRIIDAFFRCDIDMLDDKRASIIDRPKEKDLTDPFDI